MRLARCAVVFCPADPPRNGTVSVWDPNGVGLPDDIGEPGVLTVADPEVRAVEARHLSVAEALPRLLRVRDDHAAHPAAVFWSAAAFAAVPAALPGEPPTSVWQPVSVTETDLDPEAVAALIHTAATWADALLDAATHDPRSIRPQAVDDKLDIRAPQRRTPP